MKFAYKTKRFPSMGKYSLESLFLPLIVFSIVVIMIFVEPRFFTQLNISNVLRNFSVLSFIALCQGMVMIVGGFDLSVGSIMALASVVAATIMISFQAVVPNYPLVAVSGGIGVGLLAGALAGSLNGVLVSKLKASPFIITMGTMSIISGSIYVYTKGVPIYGLPRFLVTDIGRGRLFDLPLLFFIALAAILVVWFIMAKLPIGRHAYAVGSNARAAFESGINPTKTLIVVYTFAGFLAAFAGLIITTRIGAGQSGIGANAAIESIAAAIIGGVSLRGGIGSIPRIALGAFFLAIISNALNLAQINSKYQTMVLGFFLIFAIAIERRIKKEASND